MRAGWIDIPYEQDEAVQRFIEAHPDGATQVEIAAFLGVSKARAGQIEAEALRRLKTEIEKGNT